MLDRRASITTNFFYSSFITVAGYVFTFATYPYVSRVLGVERIGAVNFTDSVINYFIMLSMMGVGIIGLREVAKARDDEQRLSEVFSSVFAINLVLTAVAMTVLGVAYMLVPELQQHSGLMGIGVFKLLANIFLMDWFFKGMENFRVIAIRTFVVRSVFVAAVFCMVRDADDYWVYYVLTTLVVVANATVNCLYMRRFVRFRLGSVNLVLFLRPVMLLGLYMVFGSFYSYFNTLLLGIMCGDVEVGYFSSATKLFTIIMGVFSAFSTVMLPRMSSLLGEGKREEFTVLFRKSLGLLFAFCIPLVLLTVIQADNIILLVAGPGYEGAVMPMIICMPLLLIIGYNQILHNQCLMPAGADKAILKTTVAGGLWALLFGFVVIPSAGSIGSATVWLGAESVVCGVSITYVKRQIGEGFPAARFFKALAVHIPLAVVLLTVREVCDWCACNLLLAACITFAYCFVLQCFVLKDNTIRHIFRLSHAEG